MHERTLLDALMNFDIDFIPCEIIAGVCISIGFLLLVVAVSITKWRQRKMSDSFSTYLVDINVSCPNLETIHSRKLLLPAIVG